jgi:hypothetical protein
MYSKQIAHLALASQHFPTTIHSFSFHQRFEWRHDYANGLEMAEYLNDAIDRHDLRQHLHTSIEVIRAQWIDDKNTWCVELKDLESGLKFNRYCTILISAAGLTSMDAGGKGDEEQYFDAGDVEVKAPEVLKQIIEPRVKVSRLSRLLRSYLPLYQRGARLGLQLQSAITTLPSPTDNTLAQRPAHDNIEIIGARDQTSLSRYWKETRTPQAYWGCLVAGFPNFAVVC